MISGCYSIKVIISAGVPATEESIILLHNIHKQESINLLHSSFSYRVDSFEVTD